tara:strand:- start:3371 stop:4039 length:669 start_codon:yes stop_codon:yes gene_type:complete
MIQWNKVTWYSQFFAIFLAAIIFSLGFYLGSVRQDSSHADDAPNVDISSASKAPVRFTGLEIVEKDLPELPSSEEWQASLQANNIFRPRIERAAAYGDLAKRYYSAEDNWPYIIEIRDADITADGIPEQIVSFDGGGTYGVERYEIVSGDKIIATISSPSVGRGGVLVPNPTGNGFSFIWYTNGMFPNGFCCPVGKLVTRFVYAQGEFRAAEEAAEYEQLIW